MITQLRREPGNDYSIRELTDLFSASRSGYRYHLLQPMTESRRRKMEITAEIKTIHKDPKLRVYGSPRMTEELHARGYAVSENTVADWMREAEIRAKGSRPFKPPKTTTCDPSAKYSPNLIKNRKPKRFGEILVSDITYLRTRQGWMYLAVVIDLYSRAVIGWKLGQRMPASLVTCSLAEAVRAWKIDTRRAIFHSDRGSQYTSEKLRRMLSRLGIDQSMSARGNCYDNATCESFFSGFKRELMPECGYFESTFQAEAAVFEHIEAFYNTRRRHSSLGMKSPIEFINNNQTAIAA